MNYLSGSIFICVMMVITGSINTISTKLADITKSENIEGENKLFNHPFFQACCMFFGEMCCFAVFKLGEWRERRSSAGTRYLQIEGGDDAEVDDEGRPLKSDWNPVLFALPACCDMTATSLMYIGLSWTYASIFQMLRGSVMIFTGIFSVMFLGRRLKKYNWFGMFVVLIGLTLVGVSSIMGPSDSASAPNPVGGVIVILAAQLVQATQMVVEEKFLSSLKLVPLQAVGWEGIWGFSILSILLIPMYFIPGPSEGGRLENAPDAFVQMGNSTVVLLAILGNIVSIGFFNYFGVTVTKTMSATTRMVLDSVRTLVIWVFGLLVGWEEFQYMQAIGFPFLIIGMFIYNGSLKVPCFAEEYIVKEEDDDMYNGAYDGKSGGKTKDDINLHDVLANDEASALFRQHCDDSREARNMYSFYADVCKFRGDRKAAGDIMNTYFVPEAAYPVSIDGLTRRQLEERFEQGEYSEDMFDVARDSVLRSIEREVYPSFKSTQSFSCLAVVGPRNKTEARALRVRRPGLTTTLTLRVVG